MLQLSVLLSFWELLLVGAGLLKRQPLRIAAGHVFTIWKPFLVSEHIAVKLFIYSFNFLLFLITQLTAAVPLLFELVCLLPVCNSTGRLDNT